MIRRILQGRSRPVLGRAALGLILAAGLMPRAVLAQVESPVESSKDLEDGGPAATRPAPAASDSGSEPTTRPSADRLTLSEWAPNGFLKNPVALSFDRQGRAYVAQTQRREGGEVQVRTDPAHRVIPDHSFQSVEDRFRWAGDGDPAWGEQAGGKKEIISVLEDSRHTGKVDKATVFYSGFNQNGTDILAGVLWSDGNVYATAAPNLWLLRDTNGDQKADQVKSLLFGFSVHMSYSGHNMHGLTLGPDGKIYFTIGDKGLNVTTPEGKHAVYPFCGACMRCNPDGSDFEVFAYGLRNVQEIAFDRYGNLFGVDNDGDYPTERERLVYITRNSDSGWRFNWQYRSKRFDVQAPPDKQQDRYNPWMDERMWVPYFAGQAAYITPPLANYTDGPAGFKYATEGSLDPRYREHFFVVEFPKATIRAFAVKPKGAYFELTDDQVVSKGIQCTGLALGPDGALYGCGWGKTAFKLGNTGTIMKLDNAQAAASPLRRTTQKLLEEGPSGRSVAELAQLLSNEDMRVRMDAQFELVRRKAIDVLRQAAFSKQEPQMGRIHGLWGLGELIGNRGLDAATARELARQLDAACNDADPEIRAQSVKLLGEEAEKIAGTPGAGTAIRLLGDESARVRYFAAMSLGQFKDRSAVGPLLQLLATNRPVDPYIRHAAVMGLVGIGDVDELLATTSNPSVDVRLGAVVALRRLRNAGVARFLADRDPLVATEAARAIHDDYSIPDALPALAEAVQRRDITSEVFVRRALNANLRLGGEKQVARLVDYACDETRPTAMRVEAIDMLANWLTPAVNDRVEGWYRTWPRRSGFAVRELLADRLAGLVASSDPQIAAAAAGMIDELGLKADDAQFAGWVADENKPTQSRVAALQLLAHHKYNKLNRVIDQALASHQPLLRSAALRVMAEAGPAHAIKQIKRVLESGSVPEKQTAFHLLATLGGTDGEQILSDWMDRLQAHEVAPEVQLDLLEAARTRGTGALKQKLARYDASLPGSDPLARFLPCMTGGDAERGRAIFAGDSDAACIRCHSVDGTGSTVAPNLAGIASKPDKTRRYILESLIDPNAYVVPGYGMTSFTLKNGKDVAGFVRSEDATTVRLVGLQGETTVVNKSDVASRTPPVSVMPPMGAILTPIEIRDVIAYVESLK